MQGVIFATPFVVTNSISHLCHSTCRQGTMSRHSDCMNSKVLWRALLVFAIFALVANLFRPPIVRLHGLQYWGNVTRSGSHSKSSHHDATFSYDEDIDWSQYAYCQYVTNEAYLCNAVMIFEALVRLEAKAERLMLYPEDWTVADNTSIGELLMKARDEFDVRLEPVQVQHFEGDLTWAESFTKLLAFNQTRYKRVISLDSDSTVLQPMDELFLLPSAPVAMPRAYWLDDTLSSQLVLVEPSTFEFERIQAAFARRAKSDFDMEIVNDLYGESCLVLPHRRYDLITGEFRAGLEEHARYLGSKEERWDGEKVLAEAKFLHFSDWPVNKPWLPAAPEVVAAHMPKCVVTTNETTDCRDQELWLGFYEDFRERRLRVCGVDVQ